MTASLLAQTVNYRRSRPAWPWVAVLLWACMASAAAQDWSYRVRPGDTLWDLSGTYLKPGIAWQKLQAHNKVSNPYSLPPGSTLHFPLAWLRLQPAKARVVAVTGQASAEGKGKPAAMVVEGMELEIGTVLRTAKGTNLSLEFADGSRLLLKEDSVLHLDRMTRYGNSGMVDTRLRLQQGRITNTVQPTRGHDPSFIVDTPNASSAVRGTHFRVDAGTHGTLAEVTEGKVMVGAGRRQALLKQGYGTAVATGQHAALQLVKLLPAPDLSGLPARLDGARARLDWQAVEGARAYRVEVSDTPRFEQLFADLQTEVPSATLPVLPDGDYAVRVRGIDARGLQGLDSLAQVEIEALPQPPYAISPTLDAVVRDARPEFRWSQAADAGSYRFELADAASFDNPLLSLPTQGPAPLRLPQALAPGRYYWRIASNAADGRHGPFSEAMGFEVRPLPEAGEIGHAVEAKVTTFRWRGGEPGQTYRFQLSRSAQFDTLQVNQVVDQPQISVPRLRAGTWYLRAQGIGSDGHEGPVPATQSVQVPCRLCGLLTASGALLLLLAL